MPTRPLEGKYGPWGEAGIKEWTVRAAVLGGERERQGRGTRAEEARGPGRGDRGRVGDGEGQAWAQSGPGCEGKAAEGGRAEDADGQPGTASLRDGGIRALGLREKAPSERSSSGEASSNLSSLRIPEYPLSPSPPRPPAPSLLSCSSKGLVNQPRQNAATRKRGLRLHPHPHPLPFPLYNHPRCCKSHAFDTPSSPRLTHTLSNCRSDGLSRSLVRQWLPPKVCLALPLLPCLPLLTAVSPPPSSR